MRTRQQAEAVGLLITPGQRTEAYGQVGNRYESGEPLLSDLEADLLFALKRLMDAPHLGTAVGMRRAREHAQAVIDKAEAA